MKRITEKMLQTLVDRLNVTCGHPLDSYIEGKPQALNCHIDYAYSGVALYQMSSIPGCTGINSIFNSGHITKRGLYTRINAYIAGIETGKIVYQEKLDKEITFTRINNNTNGNPRYVCHYLAFGNVTYEDALKLSQQFGGKKFHNKQYGGGIVFSTYNLNKLRSDIKELVKNATQ